MQPLRILLQNRPNVRQQPGGDTVVMDRLYNEIQQLGHSITVDASGGEACDPYDIVHLFNFATPQILRTQAERAHSLGKPFVVTTLFEDLPQFQSESRWWAERLMRYVQGGQKENTDNLLRWHPDSAAATTHFDNQWVVDHASRLFACGDSERAGIHRAYGRSDSISVVPFGFDRHVPSVRNPVVSQGVERYVLCVGRLESRKNQLMLLHALEDLPIPVVFVAGNFSYQPDYAEAVRSFRRAGPTIFMGRLSDEELAAAYAGARVHVLPSWFELPGLVTLEAAWQGCSVVAGNRGAARDYLGAAALYCDPSCVESIRNGVLAAWHMPPQVSMKEQLEPFTWASHAQAIVAEYTKIVGSRTVTPVRAAIPQQPGLSLALPKLQIPGLVQAPMPVSPSQETTRSTDEIIDQAEQTARRQEFALAHDLLDQALQREPENSRALRIKATVFLAENRPEIALPLFEQAIKRDAHDARALSGYGMCHVALKHFSSAYPFFVQSLKEDPYQLVSLLNLMECSYAIGRYDDLEQALNRYVTKHPNDIEMRYCLAAALFKLNQYDESQKHLDMVLTRDPAHRGGKELQQTLAAQAKAKRPVTVDTNTVTSVESQLGELEGLKRTQQYTLVVERCDEMLKVPTDDKTLREKVLILKADSKALSGYEDDARQLYEQVLLTNPQSSRALSGQGALAAYKNDWDTARSLFSESHALDPRNDAALAGLGLCVRQVNDREGAWGFFTRSLAMNPENSGALYGLIEVGHALGRIEDVERHIHEYLDLHPGDLDVLHALAECQLALGRRADAQNTLRTLQIFDPEGLRTRDLSGRLQRYEDRAEVTELPPLR